MNSSRHVYRSGVLALIVLFSESCGASAGDSARLPGVPETEFSTRWPLSSLALAPNGKFLASADRNRGVCLWDLRVRRKVWEIELPAVGAVSNENVALAFTADGKTLLLASHVRDPLVLDASSGKTLRTIGHEGEWFAPALALWRKNGTELAVTSSGGNLHFWNPSNGNDVMTLKGAGRKVVSLQVAKNAARIALGQEALGPEDQVDSGRVLVRELPSGRIVLDVRHSPLPVRQLAISPNGEHLIGASDQELGCWSVERKERLWSRKEACGGMAMSPDGKILAYGCGARVVLCDVPSGATIASAQRGLQTISAVTFAHDGAFIAVGAEGGAIAVWRLLAGRKEIRTGRTGGVR